MKRVLLVDDANDLRGLLVTVLDADERFSVVGDTATGEEAAAVAEQTKPDVCIVDVNLGYDGMTGESTALALRALLPDAVIVLYSGDDRHRADADRIGVPFVEKMMNPSRFCDAIAAAVGA